MKLTGAEAARRLAAQPDPARAGILLHGPDAMLVALLRQEMIAALIGPDGEAEMRLERLAAADLRRDPAAIGDAMRARGFFAGPRVVLIEGATDAVAAPILDALATHRPGDACLVVAAGQLPARSSLRKGFESARNAAAIGLYPDPPGRAEIEAALLRAGLDAASPEALDQLLALGADLDPGAFARFIEVVALHKGRTPGPLRAEDVAAVAPQALEGDIDALLDAVAEGRPAAVIPSLRRLAAQGSQPVGIAIAASRHFRSLHAAAAAADAEAALARLRPPVFGPRRARMASQARRLGLGGTEKALMLITDTDLALRSPRPLPGMALVERALIRIASLPRRGR